MIKEEENAATNKPVCKKERERERHGGLESRTGREGRRNEQGTKGVREEERLRGGGGEREESMQVSVCDLHQKTSE